MPQMWEYKTCDILYFSLPELYFYFESSLCWLVETQSDSSQSHCAQCKYSSKGYEDAGALCMITSTVCLLWPLSVAAVSTPFTSSSWSTPGLTISSVLGSLDPPDTVLFSYPSGDSEARCPWPTLSRCPTQLFLLYSPLSLRKIIHNLKIR